MKLLSESNAEAVRRVIDISGDGVNNLGRSIAQARDEALAQGDTVLRAEALRLSARALARVTGRVDVEDILGEIFGRFSIGK